MVSMETGSDFSRMELMVFFSGGFGTSFFSVTEWNFDDQISTTNLIESHFNETSIHALHLISKNDKLMQAFSRNKMHEMGY